MPAVRSPFILVAVGLPTGSLDVTFFFLFGRREMNRLPRDISCKLKQLITAASP